MFDSRCSWNTDSDRSGSKTDVCGATVVDCSERTWLWVEGGLVVSSLQQRKNGQQDSDGVAAVSVWRKWEREA